MLEEQLKTKHVGLYFLFFLLLFSSEIMSLYSMNRSYIRMCLLINHDNVTSLAILLEPACKIFRSRTYLLPVFKACFRVTNVFLSPKILAACVIVLLILCPLSFFACYRKIKKTLRRCLWNSNLLMRTKRYRMLQLFLISLYLAHLASIHYFPSIS